VVAAFGIHQTDAEREVVVGTAASTATADYDSYNMSVAVETGSDMALPITGTLTPFIGVEYSHSNRDGFTESGAGTANLSADDENEDSLRAKIGFRISDEIATQGGRKIAPFVSVAYVREMLDDASQLEAGFESVPTTTFRIDGPEIERNRLQVGFGVTGQLNDRATLNLGYNGELATSDDNHSFAATFRYAW
jgi:outer membrane autotransporter protein